MTINSTAAFSGPYVATGVAQVFPFSFDTKSADEVQVTADGIVIDPTTYSVRLEDDGTGSVTATLTAGARVYVESNPDFAQSANFARFAPYFPDAINTHLDRAAIRDIKLLDQLDRTFVIPRDYTAFAGKFARISGAGQWELVDGVPGIAGPAAAFRASLLDLKAAATTDGVSQFNGSQWYWTPGNFTGLVDDVNYVAANTVPVTVGAWVREQRPTIATRARLKATPAAAGDSWYLTEAGRVGWFRWTLGDYSARVAADTQEGVFLGSSLMPASTGAWVRQVQDGDLWNVSWFAVPTANSDGTGTNATPAYNAMMAVANLVKPTGIQFAAAQYAFDSKPTEPTYVLTMQFSTGTQPTQLVKRYMDAATGVLGFTGYGSRLVGRVRLTSITGGNGLNNLGLSWRTNGNVPIIGEIDTTAAMIIVSMNGNTGDGVLFDGSSNNGADPKGLRNASFGGLEIFNNLRLRSCQHFMMPALFLASSIFFEGTASAKTDDVRIDGVIGQDMSFGTGGSTAYIERVVYGGEIANNLYNFSDSTKRCVILGSVIGIVETNWERTTCYALNRSVIRRSGSNANGTWIEYGDGRIEQYGTAITVSGSVDITFPIPFTDTVTALEANVLDPPGVNGIMIAQAYSPTLVGAKIRSAAASSVPAVALVGANVCWVARGR